MTRHEEHVENLGAYALGALPELEARVLERHVMGCASCQDELGRLQEAADALPRSVPPYEAPASLKASLMDVVNAEAAPAAARAPKPRARRDWFARLRPATPVAVAACAVLLAFFAGSQLAGDAEPRTVAAQVDAERLPDATASLLVPEDDGRGAVLRVQGLPEAGPGRIYQVWVQRGNEVIPVSIFDVDASGHGAAAIPEPLEDVGAVMVTREQKGGAAAPSELPVIRAEV